MDTLQASLPADKGYGLCRTKSFDLPALNVAGLNGHGKGKSSGEEIGQENLKHSLQEIISEIEQVASQDELLLEDDTGSQNVVSPGLATFLPTFLNV